MIKIRFKYGILPGLLLLVINVFSQDGEHDFGIKETAHFGALLPHRQQVNEIVEGHTVAYELSFYKSTSGKKDWQRAYAYPKVGISAMYHYLGNPNELGNAYGLFGFVDLPLNQRKINWRLKMGYGLGYIEKPFDKETNNKNVAIGSHFNALIYANMGWDAKLSDALNLSSGLSIIHYSNGAFAMPNLGINIVSLNVGAIYNFGNVTEKLTDELPDRDRTWKKQVMVGFGAREVPPTDGPKYFVNTYSFNLMKPLKRKGSFGVGFDVFYNSALPELILLKGEKATTGTADKFRVGIAGIYSFDFGKISFLVEAGGYLYTNYAYQGRLYNRFTTRYLVSDKVFLNLGLKTHMVVADFIEAGIGYTIGK
ncbi:MAG: acyloxyacyl hydrolase [Flavobacteriales bacterium]|nr:acyloxyacyl hydrolase [Flavobacteriales bacterium]